MGYRGATPQQPMACAKRSTIVGNGGAIDPLRYYAGMFDGLGRRRIDRHGRRRLSKVQPNSDQYGRHIGVRGSLITRTNGGLSTKLCVIFNGQRLSLDLFVIVGQVSDYIRAQAFLNSLPNVNWLLGDRGYDADLLRAM